MVEFWRKLGLFLGWGVPPGDQAPAVDDGPVLEAALAPSIWALGFDSPLPGMRGRFGMPVGPGRTLAVPFGAITVSQTFWLLGNLSEELEKWPFGPDLESFAAYVALEGPGWDLTVFFRTPAPLVEYYAGRKSGAAPVSGRVGWPIVAQALVLSPDYEAVLGYLKLNPYRAENVV